jgi:hypothetical protein
MRDMEEMSNFLEIMITRTNGNLHLEMCRPISAPIEVYLSESAELETIMGVKPLESY